MPLGLIQIFNLLESQNLHFQSSVYWALFGLTQYGPIMMRRSQREKWKCFLQIEKSHWFLNQDEKYHFKKLLGNYLNIEPTTLKNCQKGTLSHRHSFSYCVYNEITYNKNGIKLTKLGPFRCKDSPGRIHLVILTHKCTQISTGRK